jgi:phosphonate ABC transporter permease subunit PhnE
MAKMPNGLGKAMETKTPPRGRALRIFLITIVIFVVLAYGVEVTNVDLSPLREPQRVAQLTRVIRALFHPDIIKYDQVQVVVNAPVYVPCPSGDLPESVTPTEGEAYVVITPGCGSPGDVVRVEGFGFAPQIEGPLRFIPSSDPNSLVTLGRDIAATDDQGHFSVDFTLPNRISEDVQFIRTVISENTGSPYLSRNAQDTWTLIIQTIFLALLATIVGTMLAVPLSFLAARNLMKSVRSPLASIALNTLGWIAGIYLGLKLAGWISQFSEPYANNVFIALAGVVLIPLIIILAFRWAAPEEELNPPQSSLRILRTVVVIGVALLVVFGLFALAGLMMGIGFSVSGLLGPFGFLGSSLFHLGDILRTIIPIFFALAAGGTLGSFAGRYGQVANEKLPAGTMKGLNILLSALSGAVLFALLGGAIEWLYQIGSPEITLWIPVGVGALLGALVALRSKAKGTLPIGLIMYYIIRTVLNALRAIEPLIYCIVFVIAFSLGPFPGVLALGLHTIVSLAKLYSEQVESISAGPLEAIEATGANRLQTIIFAVIPQVIPPYISYTMYRWDINVRMSTVIGFVGGGGIGFLLYQNINLLRYPQAATQILAIAVVVASLDYISSVVRERFT